MEQKLRWLREMQHQHEGELSSALADNNVTSERLLAALDKHAAIAHGINLLESRIAAQAEPIS